MTCYDDMNFCFNNNYLCHHKNHILLLQRVLPKVRSFTVNSGTTTVVLPKEGVPPDTRESELQFY